MAESELYLVSFDTDRIKDYVFATQDLKKIRGASALLEFLNQKDTPRIIRETCRKNGYDIPEDHIVKGGGTAMAVVPTAELAGRVKAAVEGIYRSTAITGSITGTHLQVHSAELQTRAFGRRVACLGVLLRKAKDAKGHELAFPLTAYTRPCGACGRYPGVKPDPDEPAQALCTSCLRKHEWSPIGKNVFHTQFQSFVREDQGTHEAWLDVKLPQTFGEIGRAARPSGYLGFIYADGNGIGSLLEEMRDFPAYRHFATELDTLVRRTTYCALLHTLKCPRASIAPFEVLLMGGDDLMLVVAADAALEVALEITEAFERDANTLAHSPEVGLPQEVHLSLSIGVVISHDTFPVKAMRDVAGDLLRRAKRKTAEIEAAMKLSGRRPEERAAVSRGTVDFLVITEAATAGLDAVRDKVLTHASFPFAPTGGEKFALTERPYTAERLRKLLDYARQFKQQGFPRTSLHAMYEAVFQSKSQAQLMTVTTLARAKRENRELGLRFFDDFGVPRSLLPWREESDKQFFTPLGDLVEIYPFA